MGSRLSSALVQAGLLEVKSLKSALARQAILGGALDSILLEKGLVDEASIMALLSQVTGFPALLPEQLAGLAPLVPSPMPPETAQQLGVCPLRDEAEALTLLITETTDDSALDALASELGRRLRIVVGAEVRLMQARRDALGAALPPRFAKLLGLIGEEPPRVTPAVLDAARLPEPAATRSFIEPPASVLAAPSKPAAAPVAERKGVPTERTEKPTPVEAVPEPLPVPETIPSTEAEALRPTETLPLKSPEVAPTVETPAPIVPRPDAVAVPPEAAALPTEMPPIPEDADEPEAAPSDHVALTSEELVPEAAKELDRMEVATVPDGIALAAPIPSTEEKPGTPTLATAPATGQIAPTSPRKSAPTSPIIMTPTDPINAVPTNPVAVAPTSPRKAAPAINAAHPEPVSREPRKPTDLPHAPMSPRSEPLLTPIETGSSSSPMPLDQAVALMRSAANRDDLLLALARGGHRYLQWLCIFVVGKDELGGWLEVNGGRLDQVSLRNLHLHVTDASSLLGRALSDGELLIGSMPPDDAAAVFVRQRAPESTPQQVFMPICIKKRPVCLLLGTPWQHPLPASAEHALRRLAEEAGVALLGLIMRQKQAGSASAPRRPPDPKREVALLVEQVEQGGPSAAAALDKLLLSKEPAIEALLARFPGKVGLKRPAVERELPAAELLPPIPAALLRFDRAIIPGLTPMLHHRKEMHRLYATWLVALIKAPESVLLLASRLLDTDGDIRLLAALGLLHMKSFPHVRTVVDDLRQMLRNPAAENRPTLCEALGRLAEPAAATDLMERLEDPDPLVADAAWEALRRLTLQDFGREPGPWRTFLADNRERHRLEWLIDGLVHPDPALRDQAIHELKVMTGFTFGYRMDMNATEQAETRDKFRDWWRRIGRSTFASTP